jgi:hypothetical protein
LLVEEDDDADESPFLSLDDVDAESLFFSLVEDDSDDEEADEEPDEDDVFEPRLSVL